MTVALEQASVDAQTDAEQPAAVLEAAQTPDAPVAKADDKYADKEVSEEASRRVLAARDAGWSRKALQEHTELTPAQLWRIEKGRIHRAEVAQLVEVLDKIDAGELVVAGRKGGKISDAQVKINAALAILRQDRPKATKADLMQAIDEAVHALAPEPVVDVPDEVVEENQES